MVEKWDPSQRLKHTRDLLLDSAEEAFARHGFAGAVLDDIAADAGYTRGAITSHFGSKEDLFLAAVDRHLERMMTSFDEAFTYYEQIDPLLAERLADRWRGLASTDRNAAALNYEFALYLLRNPDARDRVELRRQQTMNNIAEYIEQQVQRLGGELQMPAVTLARLLVASTEGILMSGHVDGQDLLGPVLEARHAELR